MTEQHEYEAGVWEQIKAEHGDGLVVWSTHSTQAEAEAEARRYASRKGPATGGALSWAGGWRVRHGPAAWLDRHGGPV